MLNCNCTHLRILLCMYLRITPGLNLRSCKHVTVTQCYHIYFDSVLKHTVQLGQVFYNLLLAYSNRYIPYDLSHILDVTIRTSHVGILTKVDPFSEWNWLPPHERPAVAHSFVLIISNDLCRLHCNSFF